MRKNKSLLKEKFFYTALMVLIYLVGKGMPLYMIDIQEYTQRTVNTEALLVQTISGDINQCSLFALGVSPYMLSSMIVQIFYMFRSPEAKKSVSPIQKNKVTLNVMFVLSVTMALTQVQGLQFAVADSMLFGVKLVATIEMVAGAFLILFMVSRNTRYGVGGQTVFIFMNILDGIVLMLRGQDIEKLTVPLLISMVVLCIVIIMENTEKRIPVQRISIHNIYSDKNYLAIKLNPIGVMPVMFSTAFFILPQLLVTWLVWAFPENADIILLQNNMSLTKPLGIGVYAIILFLLTIGFSRVMLNPKEITDNLLKSGDSIQDLHAGRDTRKYLSGVINRLSLLSASVMGICLCVPLLLQMSGEIDSTFANLPSSVMMLTGIWCNLSREVSALRDLEAYKPFI